MKIFAFAGVVLALINAAFGFFEGSVLQIVSALSLGAGFICLFLYAKARAEKYMNLFAVFLAIHIVFSTIRLFTEKGYF